MSIIKIEIQNPDSNKIASARKKKFNFKYIIIRKTAQEDYIFSEDEKNFLAKSFINVNNSLNNTNIDKVFLDDDHYKLIITTKDENDVSLVVNKIGTLLGRHISKKFQQTKETKNEKEVTMIHFDNFSFVKGKLWTENYFIATYTDMDILTGLVDTYLKK